jgi:hypothetical protein
LDYRVEPSNNAGVGVGWVPDAGLSLESSGAVGNAPTDNTAGNAFGPLLPLLKSAKPSAICEFHVL